MKGKNWKKKALVKAIAGVFVCTTLMPLDGVASIICDQLDAENCILGTEKGINSFRQRFIMNRGIDYNENGTKYFYTSNIDIYDQGTGIHSLRNLGAGTIYVVGNSPDHSFILGEELYDKPSGYVYYSGNYAGGKIIFKSESGSALSNLYPARGFSNLTAKYVLENKKGVMAFIGNKDSYAAEGITQKGYKWTSGGWTLTYAASDVDFVNYDSLYLNKFWCKNFISEPAPGMTNASYNKTLQFINKSNGSIYAEAGALFTGNYSLTENKKPKTIFISNASGDVSNVTTDKFSDISYVQTGSLTLKDDWKKYSKWESGGQIIFTDVAPGTALANSITSQFQAAFGTGTSIKFTGTGSSSGSGSGSSSFDMNVVNALISEGKLASGSVVTSEALTHTGKSFTLGNTGDMTQDTGFMGIQGSTGITVKDGKTLTLMGSQATMAMAVDADAHDANYVITDAPMSLTNGNLNLGHANLSATEGKLAAVTYDNQSTVNVNNGIFTFESLKGNGAVTVAAKNLGFFRV